MADLSHHEQRDAIMKAVGKALDQWSHVELALENLFASTLSIPEGPAHVVLSSIRSFNVRLLMVNNLVTSLAMSPEIRTAWTNLYNRMSNKNDARNELAHFTIMESTDTKGKTTVALLPYYSMGGELLRGARDPLKPAPPGLSAKQIEERALSFANLATKVHEFHWTVHKFLAQRKAFLEQARGRPQLPDTPSDHSASPESPDTPQ